MKRVKEESEGESSERGISRGPKGVNLKEELGEYKGELPSGEEKSLSEKDQQQHDHSNVPVVGVPSSLD